MKIDLYREIAVCPFCEEAGAYDLIGLKVHLYTHCLIFPGVPMTDPPEEEGETVDPDLERKSFSLSQKTIGSFAAVVKGYAATQEETRSPDSRLVSVEDRLPAEHIPVTCVLRHSATGAVRSCRLIYAVEDDLNWRTADDHSELSYEYDVTHWWESKEEEESHEG